MDIASMLEVEVQEVADSKENVTPIKTPIQTFPCQTYSKEENDFYKLTYGSDVAAIRFLRLHCTGCDEHIGSAPAEAHNMHEHPVLRTLLCAKCREFYGDGTFEQGDDATDMFCRWCANGGNLYCCSYCSNTFCSKCIKRNFDAPTIKRIEAEDSWKCFVCDPKDLYPLRSVARALITHIETVTRILENDKRMSPKDVEEKMHLDETKCCSRKRKRRRRRTLSNTDDDEEEDLSYVPEIERSETPPMKRRKVRKDSPRTVHTNGYLEHKYYKRRPKTEPDVDPDDLMIPCEQTMIEGDGEIINANNSNCKKERVLASKEEVKSSNTQSKVIKQQQQKPQQEQSQSQQLSQQKTLQKQQFKKILPNNTMSINPVPLANLLKVALSTGTKKFKVTHTGNQKLVAVPMSVIPKSVATSSISFVKPSTTHFLLSKNVGKTLPQPLPSSQPQQTRTVLQSQMQPAQPNVIDLDSDDEPVILENKSRVNNNSDVNVAKTSVVEEIDMSEENIVPEQIEIDNVINNNEDEPMVVPLTEPTKTRTMGTMSVDVPPTMTLDGVIHIKTQHRDQRFKKMLILQSQEIDNTVGELRMKILKLIQMAENSKPQQDADLLNSAALCTKRFNRALRKTMVELSHINDRVVRDYVHWKKRMDKGPDVQEENLVRMENGIKKQRKKSNDSDKSKGDLTLEMICVNESATESEGETDDNETDSEERSLEAIPVPADLSQLLDHLTIFKRKPTGVKAVGDSSVLTEDKACQAYDVPWRDYEKCIGYSLLTRSEFDSDTQKEELQPVTVPDENFGKYQEQYLFYLQHIEDFGIETDETKGLPDPNHIPVKDLRDGTSPFIMDMLDMLDRFSPVALSNGYQSPRPTSPISSYSDISVTPETVSASSNAMDTTSPSTGNIENRSQNSTQETTATATAEKEKTEEKPSEENVAATSKAVEELVKMVTKLSEDLRSEKETDEVEKETVSADDINVKIKETTSDSNQEQGVANEVTNSDMVVSNDECTTLD